METNQDELARKEELRIAEQHRQFVENPVFKDAIGKLRDGLLKIIEDAPLSETDKVRDAQRGLKIISKLIAVLSRPMQTGDMAAAQLLDLNEQRKRLGLFNRR